MGQLFRGGGSSALHGVLPVQGSTRLVSPRRKGGGFPLDPNTTLAYLFTNGTLDPIKGTAALTFTRSTVGSYFDSSGNLQEAAIDEPRFDHDPVSKAPLGLMIEEPRTNIFLNSAAPVTQDVTTVADTYTISVIGTGTVTVSGTGTGVATEALPLTVPCTAGLLTCTVAGGPSYAQVELGPFASSMIVTAGSPVARAQDVCSTLDMSWLTEPQGTFYCQSSLRAPGNSNQTQWSTASTAIDYHKAEVRVTFASRVRSVTAGGQTDIQEGGNVYAFQAMIKQAYAYAANDMAGSWDGLPVQTEAPASTPPLATALRLGLDQSGGNPMNGWIQTFAFADVRKDNAFLESVTS